jgi:hypothetical protein
MATVAPELHIGVFHHVYGVDCFTFYFVPHGDLKYPSPRKVAEHFRINFEPEKGETFVVLPASGARMETLTAEQIGRKSSSTAFWWEEDEEGWPPNNGDEDIDADDSGEVAINPASVAERRAASEIRLPCFGITVCLSRGTSGQGLGGTITSNLRQEVNVSDTKYLAAIDGLESLILAHACAGIDISSPAYLEGIETAVEAIANNLA